MPKVQSASKVQSVCIIGLGYVGLPLACLCAKKGYTTYGYDIDAKKVELINQKKCPFKDDTLQKELQNLSVKATEYPSVIKNCDVVIACVPTPVDKNHLPDLSYVKKAAETAATYLKKGSLLVIESTIYPGTCEEIVMPVLKQHGLNCLSESVFLAHCPERIDPGNRQWTIENIPRVVGGLTPEATKKAAAFYRSLLAAEVTELSSIKAAEAVKIMENTFRDINIAFINEMAMSFDKLGIDILEVIKGANTKPFAFMPHYPGIGVGGHCISVDPYYLIEKAKNVGFDHKFLSLAREINNTMPQYTITRLEQALKTQNKQLKNTSVAVLGLAYKANVDDTRESPSLKIIELLKKKGAGVVVYDPYVPQQSTVKTLDEALSSADVIIIATNHNEFKEIPLEKLRNKIVIDGKNCLDKEKVKKIAAVYKGIGRE